MKNIFIIALVLIAGALTAIQANVNGGLGKRVGIIEAALVSFSVGTLFLIVLYLITQNGNLLEVFNLPKWQLTGGVLGAVYITIMVIAVPRIGIASSLVTLIVGQLIFSMLSDHFGLLNAKVILIDWKRILGFAFMIIAVILFYKK